MQSVAVGWQVYEITKRPLDLGLVGLAQFLPGILLFLVSATPPIATTAAGSDARLRWVSRLLGLLLAITFSAARIRSVRFMASSCSSVSFVL